MTNKYMSPVSIITMEEQSERYRKIEIGYASHGLRIGIFNDQGYHTIDLAPEYAGLIAQALGLAVHGFNEAKEGKS